jgi:hypothetical protein
MGLITGLLLLPLAPIRGTVWLAERIQEQAEAEFYDESAIRAGLVELEDAHAAGALSDEELVEAENELVDRLVAMRELEGDERDGAVR